MKKELIRYSVSLIVLILFGLFVYPTLYKYDKLDQRYPVKINRITGETKVLRDNGWENISDQVTVDDVEKIKQEIINIIEADHEQIKNDVVSTVVSKAVEGTAQEIKSLKQEIDKALIEVTEYKKFKKNPDNYFTIGSSRENVKGIMGTPTSVIKSGPFETWMYDLSSVDFENGKVSGWSDSSGNLNTK